MPGASWVRPADSACRCRSARRRLVLTSAAATLPRPSRCRSRRVSVPGAVPGPARGVDCRRPVCAPPTQADEVLAGQTREQSTDNQSAGSVDELTDDDAAGNADAEDQQQVAPADDESGVEPTATAEDEDAAT